MVPAGAVLAATSTALVIHRPRRGDRAPGPFRELLATNELAFVASSSGYSVAVAAVLPMVLLDVALGRVLNGPLLSMAPVLVTVVFTDWSVHDLRAEAVAALDEARHTSEFAERAGAVLRRTSLAYGSLGLVAGVLGLVVAVAFEPRSVTPHLLLDTLAYAVTAVGLLQATVLVSMGLPLVAASALAAQAVADALLRPLLTGVQLPLLEGGHVVVASVAGRPARSGHPPAAT